jgi:hypothetical protein
MAVKRIAIVVVLALVGGCLALRAKPRGSTGPYFSMAQGSINSAGYLVVSFKERNLPPTGPVSYTLQANVTLNYGCVSKSGKLVVTNTGVMQNSDTQGPQTFNADSNGNVVGALVLAFPDLSSVDVSCSNGTTLEALRVGYSAISFSDNTNGLTPSLSGTCADTCSDVLLRAP